MLSHKIKNMATFWIVCVFFLSISTVKTTTGCKEQADIIFLLDSSGSVGPSTFKSVVEFVKNLPGANIMINKYNFRIGVTGYYERTYHEIKLNEVSDNEAFRKAVGNIKYHGGSSRTDKAIKNMVKNSFLPENGARHGAKICFVVTDADKTTDKTIKEAKKAREAGIKIFAIGVGKKLKTTALEKIANGTSNTYMFTNTELRQKLIQRICDVSRPDPPSGCSPGANIIFVHDTSAKTSESNFKITLDFVRQTMMSFPVGLNSYRFGYITYGDEAHIEFHLDTKSNTPQLMSAMDNINYWSGGSETGKALKKARDIFSNVISSRQHLKKIVVLITDGRASDPKDAETQAKETKKAGIQIFVLGVGSRLKPRDKDDFKKMASEPKNQHVLIVEEFDKLKTKVVDFITNICKDT